MIPPPLSYCELDTSKWFVTHFVNLLSDGTHPAEIAVLCLDTSDVPMIITLLNAANVSHQTIEGGLVNHCDTKVILYTCENTPSSEFTVVYAVTSSCSHDACVYKIHLTPSREWMARWFVCPCATCWLDSWNLMVGFVELAGWIRGTCWLDSGKLK